MPIEDLVVQIQQATDYQKNKLHLRQQVQADLLVPHHGGLFRASPELMAFLHAWDHDELYLEDSQGNPIRCERDELLADCKQRFHMVMNRWHAQDEQLRRRRKV